MEKKKVIVTKGEHLEASIKDDLPDLESEEVQNAAVKIQSLYKGFVTRKKVKDEKANLNEKSTQEPTVEMKSAFRGYEAHRKNPIVIQPIGKQGFAVHREKKHLKAGVTQRALIDREDLPNLESKEVQDATLKIQSVYKNFCDKRKSSNSVSMTQLMPVPSAEGKSIDATKDIHDSNIKIQSEFRGSCKIDLVTTKCATEVTDRKAQSLCVDSSEDLPNLESKAVQDAAIKIQSMYRGFHGRKKHFVRDTARQAIVVQKVKEKFKEEMPALKNKDVQDASIKIQSVLILCLEKKL